ncbi:amidohydrolase family protein [Streptomyces sp. NPDC032198]|uniref:amidohydrolase family protein n=1 Tax=Streptomyces sp. NPDC032198 TaxID=3155127 RepID=UPI0033E32839
MPRSCVMWPPRWRAGAPGGAARERATWPVGQVAALCRRFTVPHDPRAPHVTHNPDEGAALPDLLVKDASAPRRTAAHPPPTAMTAWDALDMTTQGSSQHLGHADELGYLRPGACADLVAWDLHEVAPAEAWTTVVAGRVLVYRATRGSTSTGVCSARHGHTQWCA